jgi:NAD+ synthetase
VRRQPGSPLVKVVAALLPVDVEAGVTGQARATARGRLAAEAAGVDVVTVPLADAHAATLRALSSATSVTPTAFSAGQLVSTIRTPTLYGLATLLTQQGTTAVVVGTTNRDEGGFLGFFGKASDGMVDVQPIADLHKSEVRALARRLGVPDEIVDAVPTGDTFDGRVDEDMIGASYDAVELVGLWRTATADVRAALSADWSPSTRADFAALCQRLDERHAQNAHKYVGDPPAVCLAVWPRAIPGGWRDDADADDPAWRRTPADAASRFVGLTSSPRLPAPAPWMTRAHARPVPGTAGQAVHIDDVLDRETCRVLADAALAATRVPVDEHGRPSSSSSSSSSSTSPSSRLSWWDPALAERLWERVREALPPVRVVHPGDAVDSDEPGECGDEQPVWRPVGVSPYLRLLVGEPGQWLVPHVDTAFDIGDGLHRTLQSVLVALEVPDDDDTVDPGGRTRFLVDPCRHLPVAERPVVDETTPAANHRVLAAVTHRAGGALVFDHRLLHEQERFVGPGRRVLVRTDIVFRRCAPRAFSPPSRTPLPVGTSTTTTTATTMMSTATARQAALIRKDPFYRTLASDDAARRAGFFDDAGPLARDAIEDDAAFLATPLHKVARALRALDEQEARPRVVLVAAGALSPVHAGHLEMMARARAGLEANGAVVVGGFLAPDHDAYVLQKTPSSPSASRRVELAEAAVADSDWLAVDAWPALVATRALNFTEVVEHLAATLSRWLPSPRPLRVVFVCGGDNARFAHAFARRGHVVVVARRGADDVFVAEQERARADPAMRVAMAHGRVLFVDDAPVPASSSAIRAGDTTWLPAPVRARLAAPSLLSSSSPATRYELRDEGRFAVAPWLAGRDEAIVLQAWRRFVDEVKAAFAAALPAVDVVVTSAAAQGVEVRARLATQPGVPVVSLDPCTPGDHDLAVSRCFDLGGDDEGPVIVARPGSPDLPTQLARLPTGPVVLLDDDIASGATVRAVQAAMPSSTRVVEVVPLSTASVLDRLDVRDLLPGAREAGLVVRLPDGAIARVPYLWPWVRLSRRASVDVDVERSLSRRVLLGALTFFRSLEPALVVADVDPAQRVWLGRAGFAPGTTLADVCAWHLDRLPGGPGR